MTWKLHPYTSGPHEQLDLRVGERCVAEVELPGVPAGTKGKVQMANGLAWRRYTVRFDNGLELAFLDGRHIAPLHPNKKRR